MLEDFFDGHGVDFAPGVVAFFNELAEVTAGDLHGNLVGDYFAGTLFLLDQMLKKSLRVNKKR